MPFSAAALRVGADGVEVAADRQVFEDDPQHERDGQHVEAGDRQAEDHGAVERVEAVRQHADDLPAAGVPQRDRVEHGAGAERGDEAVDLRDLDQQAVQEARQRRRAAARSAPRPARAGRTSSAG